MREKGWSTESVRNFHLRTEAGLEFAQGERAFCAQGFSKDAP